MFNDSGARCFGTNRLECKGTVYPSPELVLYRWYYYPGDQSCYPVYMPRDKKTFCPSMTILPLTKKECEDLCGENIAVFHIFTNLTFYF